LSRKKNAVCTVDIRQIEKSRDLAIGTPQKDIARYEKLVAAYGNVVPVTVAEEGGMYRLIDGHARVEACARSGICDIPAVVAQASADVDNIKLSLMLSASREYGSPISEGAMIETLTKNYGHTLRELSKLVGRSKSWLSKRQTMARNLSEPLKEMILKGAVCARTAEEIAKLPQDAHAVFAANVAKDGLTKDEVYRLVRQYRAPDATPGLRRMIIETPAALPFTLQGVVTSRKIRGDVSTETRIRRAVHLVINVLGIIVNIITEHEVAELESSQAHLLKLRREMQIVSKLITARISCSGVSPGKYGGAYD
jgi:ParB family chromosome partitioning protein